MNLMARQNDVSRFKLTAVWEVKSKTLYISPKTEKNM